MNQFLADLGIHREHCLDALERVVGEQPADPAGRAALIMARCLKYVTKPPELDTMYRDLCALSADSAEAGVAAPAPAGVGGL